MKKIVLILLFFLIAGAGITVGVNAVHFLKHDSATKQVLPAQTNSSPTEIPTTVPTQPQAVEPGIPQSISIPAIQVDATVESVGMDSQGRMDIPRNSDNTAWYSPGFRPGQKGNAVIDGHLDKVTGAPAVFWNISKLSTGDKIIITDDKGQQFTFQVTDTEKYPYNEFPLQQVFGPSDKAMLNLITCQGNWNSAAKNYSHRFVVYSELVK